MRALTAMGMLGQEFITDTMDTYPFPEYPGPGQVDPLYRTGDLRRDQQYEVDKKAQVTAWGVKKGALSAPYAGFVHEGTSKMNARPFIRDGIFNNKEMLRETAEMHLKKGF